VYSKSGLGKWFNRESGNDEPGWDRYNTAGKRVGKCGDADEGEPYAACLSRQKAEKLGERGVSSFVRRKRKAQKEGGMGKKGSGEAGGGAEPIRVSTGINKVQESTDTYPSSAEIEGGIKDLIDLIKKHEKLAYDAKRSGDRKGYEKHRGHIAEFSSDIKTAKEMLKKAKKIEGQKTVKESIVPLLVGQGLFRGTNMPSPRVSGVRRNPSDKGTDRSPGDVWDAGNGYWGAMRWHSFSLR
jgi:hypothetical protein